MSEEIEGIERLLAEADQLTDPRARQLARALASALVDLVGAALKRVRELGGDDLARKLADDDLVGNLLVLCNQHPDPAPQRAERALKQATTELGSIGVTLDTVEAAGAGVRVRVTAQRGAGVDAARVRALVEAIVMMRAPDVDSIHVELGGKAVTAADFVSIDRLRAAT